MKMAKFPEPSFMDLGDKIRNQDSSITLPDYFQYSLFHCVNNACITHLKRCSSCGIRSHSLCFSKCLDCTSGNHSFHSCSKLLRLLHDSDASHHLIWKKIITNWIISYPHHYITSCPGISSSP